MGGMTSESSDEQVHREGDRHLDVLVRLSKAAGLYDEFDAEPTHEKWRRGARWR
jgi:hypothetical protein